MKTKEELKQLKEEVEKLGEKLKGLSEDELKEVTGGDGFRRDSDQIEPRKPRPIP